MRYFGTRPAHVGLCGLIILGCGPVTDHVAVTPVQAPLTNGEIDTGHPEVGYMLTGGGATCPGMPMPLESLCTVTLVGNKTILTAARCVKPGQESIVCFGGQGATFRPTLHAHPNWDEALGVDDIAVGVLDSLPAVRPAVVSRENCDVHQDRPAPSKARDESMAVNKQKADC